MNLRKNIEDIWNKSLYTKADREVFEHFKTSLNQGKIRAAEKIDNKWQINLWVKKGILIGFKMGIIVEMPLSESKSFFDKDTYPERKIGLEHNIRLVSGGSSIRDGAYVAPSVIMMPPMYINVGAYVDAGTMIDSHALVGSCAQVGKNVHLSAASQLGGVLEPIGANPVIIEDDVFIGGNCGIYEGVIVQTGAILAAGVILTAGIPVFDSVHNRFIRKSEEQPLTIPENAVIISGTRPLRSNPEYSVYCPIIVKYRDKNSDIAVTLEQALR